MKKSISKQASKQASKHFNLKNFAKKYWIQIVFAIIALGFGAYFIHIYGAFSVSDNDFHYYNSLSVADGQFFREKSGDGAAAKSSLTIQKKWEINKICQTGSIVEDILLHPQNFAKKSCEIENVNNSSEEISVGVRAQYPFINWLPQAIGLRAGMTLNLSPADSRELARIMNLLVYVVLFIFAIRFIPNKFARFFLAVIGLLPQSIFLASSLSADALNIAFSALFVAYIFKLFREKNPLKTSRKVGLILMGILLFLLKVAYTPLWILVLALKKPVLKTREKWLIFGGVLFFGGLIYVVWSHFFATTAVLPFAENNLNLILHHLPAAIIGIFLNTFTILFTALKTGTVILPEIFWLIIFAAMIFISRKKLFAPRNFREFYEKYKLIIFAILAFFGSIALTFAALMLTWTDLANGYSKIEGFQTRYILPLLPLICVIFFLPERKIPRENLREIREE